MRINPPRASLALLMPPQFVCWGSCGLSGTAVDWPFPYCTPFLLRPFVLLYYFQSPFTVPCSLTAGRHANNSPSGLCRITLNLFFLLLNIRWPIPPSLLQCVVSCRVLPAVPWTLVPHHHSLVYYALRCYGSFLSLSSSWLTVSATTTITIVISSIHHQLRLRVLPHALFFPFLYRHRRHLT